MTFTITQHPGNANQQDHERPPDAHQDGYFLKNTENTNMNILPKDAQKLKSSGTAGESVRWCSHRGKQDGSSSNNENNYGKMQRFYFGIYAQKLKAGAQRNICTAMFKAAFSQELKDGSNQSIHHHLNG